jgi:hypothetical protein
MGSPYMALTSTSFCWYCIIALINSSLVVKDFLCETLGVELDEELGMELGDALGMELGDALGVDFLGKRKAK